MRILLLVIHCSLFILIAGCSGDKRVPLSGTITLNGEPLPQASVKFIPVDQTIINTRTGANTDADGKFSLPKNRGLEPGEYIVSIYATVEYDTKTKELATVETPPTRILPKVLTPSEYNDKSAQRFTVTARGSNVYTCDVKSNVSREFEK
jgi:hypothetical protein